MGVSHNIKIVYETFIRLRQVGQKNEYVYVGKSLPKVENSVNK